MEDASALKRANYRFWMKQGRKMATKRLGGGSPGGLRYFLGWLLLPYGRNALPAFLLHIPFGWLLLVTPGVAHDDAWRKPVALAVILLLLPVVRHPAARRWLAP